MKTTASVNQNPRTRELLGIAALLLAALIWGSAFVAQSVGMDYVEPFTFNGIRSLVAAAAIGGFSFGLTLARKKRGTYVRPTAADNRLLLVGGICCGLALFLASSLQQIGLQYTTVGKSGFLTALYLIEVPIVGIFLKRKVRPLIWGCVGIALFGMYLLCMKGGFTLGTGDLFVFLCSFAYTVQILCIDHFSARVDSVKLSCIEMLVTGVVSIPCIFLFETPTVGGILAAAGPILYAALFSSGVAYTLQIVGQKLVKPTLASLLMSLESVFSLLSGVIFLHEVPTLREGIGALLMLAAILLSQVPKKERLGA